MAEKGWIRLYRQSTENPLYFSEPFDKWHAWTDLLLMVNHKQKEFVSKGQLVKLEPGQTITSMAILAERWQWSTNKVRRYFKLLVGMGMCNVNGTPNGTTITVVNWAKYQHEGQTNGTTDGITDGTADGTTGGTLTRMYKNDKKSRTPHKNVRDEVWEGFVAEMKRRGEWVEPDDSVGVQRDSEDSGRKIQDIQ